MVLRFLFRWFANNEQLISRLAESYPIRRAAKLVVYLFHKSKASIEDAKTNERVFRFKDTLVKEAKKEWLKARDGGKKP